MAKSVTGNFFPSPTGCPSLPRKSPDHLEAFSHDFSNDGKEEMDEQVFIAKLPQIHINRKSNPTKNRKKLKF